MEQNKPKIIFSPSIEVDPFACTLFTIIRKCAKTGVLRIVPLLSGDSARQLGPAEGGIAYESDSAIFDALS